jgi:hypothetical protein
MIVDEVFGEFAAIKTSVGFRYADRMPLASCRDLGKIGNSQKVDVDKVQSALM